MCPIESDLLIKLVFMTLSLPMLSDGVIDAILATEQQNCECRLIVDRDGLDRFRRRWQIALLSQFVWTGD